MRSATPSPEVSAEPHVRASAPSYAYVTGGLDDRVTAVPGLPGTRPPARPKRVLTALPDPAMAGEADGPDRDPPRGINRHGRADRGHVAVVGATRLPWLSPWPSC